ncbi:MAG: dethiobiotin synthetase [Solirubrobacteraceae bacterium]|jgi:dethiobiotin synthetase|nr:dethiobiotin synthetase [Solirubrobacteraceae bacterium]
MRGLFVTGTDTGAGKTVLAAAICAALRARGAGVAAWKPVVTGTEEPAPGGWPPDHELLGAAAGVDPERVAPLTFGPAVSPHLAAQLTGRAIEPAALLDDARRAGAESGVLVAEGVGGILVPLTPGYLVRDLALDLGLPVLVAARPGLGTINHTLLTLEALRAVGLAVAAVVLTPWPDAPSKLERSNRETIAGLGAVAVETLPYIPGPEPAALAQAGAGLPLDDWLKPDG